MRKPECGEGRGWGLPESCSLYHKVHVSFREKCMTRRWRKSADIPHPRGQSPHGTGPAGIGRLAARTQGRMRQHVGGGRQTTSPRGQHMGRREGPFPAQDLQTIKVMCVTVGGGWGSFQLDAGPPHDPQVGPPCCEGVTGMMGPRGHRGSSCYFAALL